MIGRADHATVVVDNVDEDLVILLKRRGVRGDGELDVELNRHTGGHDRGADRHRRRGNRLRVVGGRPVTGDDQYSHRHCEGRGISEHLGWNDTLSTA